MSGEPSDAEIDRVLAEARIVVPKALDARVRAAIRALAKVAARVKAAS